MSIHQLATSFSGSVVVAGEAERRVHVWDVNTSQHLASFESVLDFGGSRLAISGDGMCCVAAAYHYDGIVAYSAADGSQLWRRRDFKKAQTVKFSLDGRHVYCFFDAQSGRVFDRDTGKTHDIWRGVRDLWESPYEPIRVLEKRKILLQTQTGKTIANIPRESFAVLSVAFAPGVVCISESGGPVRCLSTRGGQELWRYSQEGEHFVRVAYAEPAQTFVGVAWLYKNGGPQRLCCLGLETCEVSTTTELRHATAHAFCQRGSRLLSSQGAVIDSASGRTESILPFPSDRKSNLR